MQRKNESGLFNKENVKNSLNLQKLFRKPLLFQIEKLHVSFLFDFIFKGTFEFCQTFARG